MAVKEENMVKNFIDTNGCNQEVRWLNTNLADYLSRFHDHYGSGTAYFLGLILPRGGEVLRLDVQVCGRICNIFRPVTMVVEGREVNGYHRCNVEEFRQYGEFGLFKTVCAPLDGNEPSN